MSTVTATPAALSLLAEIVADHGPVLFHQSGGCCDGSSPMCYPQGDFRIGARDVRTPPEQTELMTAALKDAGNPPEGIIIQSGEMHGFYNVDNRVNLYTKMLEFFDRHIGRRASP